MALVHETLYHGAQMSMQNDSEYAAAWTYRNVDTSYPFEIIDMVYWRDTLLQYWTLALYAAGLYAATIFGLQKYMQNRPAFDLKTPLILWNAGLGIFSIIGFVRTAPLMSEYMSGGLSRLLYESVCIRQPTEPQFAFWGLAFAFSKYVELGDTLFIVLRKRPLQVLQWYHHIATLVVVWITMPYKEPIGRWFIVLNYGVHSAMYPYFALKMAGVDIPKVISNMITTSQFGQMIIGFMLNAVTIGYVATGYSCFRTSTSIIAFVTVYGTFALLFGNLFYNAVLKSSKSRVQHQKKKLS